MWLGRFAFGLFWALALALVPAGAAEGELRGTITDAGGAPVRQHRVVVREEQGTGVHVSGPSDDAGQYVVVVPPGKAYRVVAVLTPTGGRFALENPELIQIDGPVVLDVTLPMAQMARPRSLNERGGVDRLFLAFIEDPALVGHFRFEAQAELADYDGADRRDSHLFFVFQPNSMPAVELGIVGGLGEYEPEGQDGEFGPTDAEAWAKIRLYRSPDNRFDVAAGARLTFPTGDEDVFLGQDALQSKLFGSISYALQAAEIIGHAGVRATGAGEVAGVPLDGRISGSLGVGTIIPFTESFSLTFEASYDGERFEDTDSVSLAALGANWRVGPWSTFRFAITGGIEGASPDVSGILGYAASF
jgi:hypothetical protein